MERLDARSETLTLSCEQTIKESNRKYTDLVKAKAGQVHMSTQFHMWTLPPPPPTREISGRGTFMVS